ncbi:hypothetical protein F5Y03DRAFT_375164 [Xylaria venustula]|nr:hypothetical protein F5Y03DRAFT_375164 [Xylaria venustula]
MMDQDQVAIIQAHPLGAHLDAACASFNEIVSNPADLETVDREVLQDLGISLLLLLRNHAVSRLLLSPTDHGNLYGDVLRLISAIALNTAYTDRIKPFLHAVFAYQPDVKIWEHIYHAVTEFIPRKATSSFLQTL